MGDHPSPDHRRASPGRTVSPDFRANRPGGGGPFPLLSALRPCGPAPCWACPGGAGQLSQACLDGGPAARAQDPAGPWRGSAALRAGADLIHHAAAFACRSPARSRCWQVSRLYVLVSSVSRSDLPDWWAYPEECAHGHPWGPGKVIVSWTPCMCTPALTRQARGPGHRTVSCRADGCTSTWYSPRHDPGTARR
jgi:hypothetical protein